MTIDKPNLPPLTVIVDGYEYSLCSNVLWEAEKKFTLPNKELMNDPLYVANYLDAYCGYDAKNHFYTMVHQAANLLRELNSKVKS